MSTSTRIFSFGLGHAPSRALIKGLARVTNGRFVFIPPFTSVHQYVDSQFQKSIQTAITNAEIQWHTTTPMINAPSKIPPIFAKDRLLVYGLCENSEAAFDSNVSVEIRHGTVQLGFANFDKSVHVNNDRTIARLAAKALILELEHRSKTKKLDTREKIVKLSLAYNILCPYTAFIAVEKRLNSNNDEMVLREIPIEICADDKDLAMSSMTSNELKSEIEVLDIEIEVPDIEILRPRNFDNRPDWFSILHKWYASLPEHPLVDQFYQQRGERYRKWFNKMNTNWDWMYQIDNDADEVQSIINRKRNALERWRIEVLSNERHDSVNRSIESFRSPWLDPLHQVIIRPKYRIIPPRSPNRNYSYVEEKTPLDADLSSHLMPAHQSLKITASEYSCLAANDKSIALEQFHRLNLINGAYDSDLSVEWNDFVVDLFWSSALEKFIVINIDCIETLYVDSKRKCTRVVNLHHDLDGRFWWCGTSSNDTLFLSKAIEGTSLFEYTFKPEFAFVKEHRSPVSCKKGEFIGHMSSNATVLALMIIQQNSEVRLDLCSLNTIERQRSIEINSIYSTHPFRSCPMNDGQWILVNPNQSQLWYISKDGDVLSKEDYAGTPLHAACMGANTLAVLTAERMNIHRLSSAKNDTSN